MNVKSIAQVINLLELATADEYQEAVAAVGDYVMRTDGGFVNLRKLSRHFGVPMTNMKNFLEDDYRFNINVAVRVGSGIADLPLSEQSVEVLDPDELGGC